MKCSPIKELSRAVRFWLFPMSKVIEDRTKELDHKLSELKQARALTSEAIKNVQQPDILRSLVISMNRTALGGK